ncbi:MAG: molybdopterin-guanine dinucleotide biosynthesis protein B [Coriobacteriales bacterium]|jgi:molybdopterin-guanine dinucleotide biosynthesis protein MobB|nr:molybdopterin-guanine dinucleotide biosynthesis protein B [Coriobacteriales bacterium]
MSSVSRDVSPILAIAFVGRQNSGKTTLLVQVVAELVSRGVRVGTVKHHSHAGFEFDIEGKDSWRHRQAGSSYTVVAAPDQMASVRSLAAELSLERIVAEMRTLARDEEGNPTLDIILVEGYRHGGLPTIELFRAANPNDADRALGGEGNDIVAVVTDIERVAAEAKAQTPPRPVFAFSDIAGIANFVLGRCASSASLAP